MEGNCATTMSVSTNWKRSQPNNDVLDAARLSVEHRLPMADSIILATAVAHRVTLWTQDADFEKVNGVRYLPKR